MRLILIRHGQTDSNVQGLLDTAPPGAGLTELGHEQAAAIPRLLAGQRVDAVYASTLVRTQQTAAPLAAARGLVVQVREGLREVAAGDLEMLGDDASIDRFLGTVGAWMVGDLDVRMPGGALGRDELARFDAVVTHECGGLASRVGPDAAAVIVAHGAMLRLWASVRAANLGSAFGARHPLHNTGMIVLDGAPDPGWRAVTWMGSAIEDLDEDRDGPAGEPLMVRSDRGPAPRPVRS